MLTPEKIQKLKTLLPWMTPQEKRETLADLARWEHEITLKMGQTIYLPLQIMYILATKWAPITKDLQKYLKTSLTARKNA
jgi:hypothetical protein